MNSMVKSKWVPLEWGWAGELGCSWLFLYAWNFEWYKFMWLHNFHFRWVGWQRHVPYWEAAPPVHKDSRTIFFSCRTTMSKGASFLREYRIVLVGEGGGYKLVSTRWTSSRSYILKMTPRTKKNHIQNKIKNGLIPRCWKICPHHSIHPIALCRWIWPYYWR